MEGRERGGIESRGRLFGAAHAPSQGERFEVLARLGGVRIEQIVSSATPEPTLYDQDHDEWVVVLEGRGELEVAQERIVMEPGDWLLIPARTPHRVVATAPGTVWLAVHAE